MQRGLFLSALAVVTVAGIGAASAQTVIVEDYGWSPGPAYVVPAPSYVVPAAPAPGFVVTAPAPNYVPPPVAAVPGYGEEGIVSSEPYDWRW